MTDLWPSDLDTVTTRAPVTILREQASLLGTKTKYILKAEIAITARQTGRRSFSYAFFLHAPALDDYRYRVFTIEYDVTLYPVLFQVDHAIAEELGFNFKTGTKSAATEEEFLSILGQILQSNKTRQVIAAILSQSMDRSPQNGDPSE
jgi:hypothetical protein